MTEADCTDLLFIYRFISFLDNGVVCLPSGS